MTTGQFNINPSIALIDIHVELEPSLSLMHAAPCDVGTPTKVLLLVAELKMQNSWSVS
jgi:hypothetical protein